ncbi:hypothetical protein KY338_07115 [Candidatus Woesearchaeota archaeon]|nr:hypothetical protein [Candidatus Woesearchaeota archaeon]MBW3005829.1 hypothetical protein [Candidatus Woesearchaeota archaeon]
MNWRTRTFLAFAITTISFLISSIFFTINSLVDFFASPISLQGFLMTPFMNMTYFLSQFADITLNITHIKMLLIVCYTIAAILLLKNTHKKTAWIFAMIPPLFLLLNPLFIKGTLIILIEHIIELNFGGVWAAAAESILPIMVIIYAITSLAGVKNKIFDKTIGIIFIILFLISPLIVPVSRGNLSFYFITQPVTKFVFFILLVILLPKMFKKA